MDFIFYLASSCLLLFMLLATYDGFYLHIFKYELFNRNESFFEHQTHTIRALLFPLIVWLLFINYTSFIGFLIGIALVVLDLIVLGIDAYSEKESRSFMGGLPKWEYIIHLFSNTFHFAAIVLVLALKLGVSESSLTFITNTATSPAKDLFLFISVNVLPGAVILALLHFLLMVRKPRLVWNTYRHRITCC